MKKTITKTFFRLFLALIVSIGFLYVSCSKNVDCDGVVTVIDLVTNQPVLGATVKLSATGTTGKPGQVTDTQMTDGSGKSYHKFRLPAIFDVNVTSGAKKGTGIMKLEPGSTVEVTVKIQ